MTGQEDEVDRDPTAAMSRSTLETLESMTLQEIREDNEQSKGETAE